MPRVVVKRHHRAASLHEGEQRHDLGAMHRRDQRVLDELGMTDNGSLDKYACARFMRRRFTCIFGDGVTVSPVVPTSPQRPIPNPNPTYNPNASPRILHSPTTLPRTYLPSTMQYPMLHPTRSQERLVQNRTRIAHSRRSFAHPTRHRCLNSVSGK